MNDFLLQLHSGVRWLVVLATVIAIVKLAIGIIGRQPYDPLTQRLMLVFSGLLSLQWLLGLILFVVLNSFGVLYRWEHAVTMTIAVAVSHLHRRWKSAPDSTRYRSSLIIVVIVLMLVFIGVALLPQGWRLSPGS